VRIAAQRQQSEARRRETLRVVLLECAGFVIPAAEPSGFHVNKRWPPNRAARAECEGFLRCTDPDWSQANREVCGVWVARTWIPAAFLVRRRKLTSEVIAHEPTDAYEKETRRLFKRLLVAGDIRDEGERVTADLVAAREQLAEDRRALGRYFETLWNALRAKLEAKARGAPAPMPDRFQRALDAVEWARTMNPELGALLDPVAPWSAKALGKVWRYIKDTVCEGYSAEFPLPDFHTWTSYVRKGRSKLRK